MKQNLFILMIFFLMEVSGMATVKITNIKKQTGLYEPMFINLKIDKAFINPYDQTDIKVDALFLTPTRDTLVLPCFFKEGSAGQSTWEARFLPRMQGKYSMFIRVVGKQGAETSAKSDFTVTPSKGKGLLSFDPKSYYFLKFDNGDLFRGIGLNVGWQYEPKWDNKQTTTFPMYFDAMETNKANFLRMWICPWNYPIEWTPVVNYQMLTDEFKDWSHMVSHSPGLTISPGPTPVTQTDTAQLLKTTDGEESIVYRLDSVRKVKVMIYYKGNFSKDDIDMLASADNKNYQKIRTELSESWESSEGWKRIFLFSFDEIPQPANYIKFVFKSNIQDNVKLAGIQFRYGKALSQLDCNGLSRYSVKNSMILDSIFSLAGKKGIHIMLTLGYHGQFNPIMDSWGANDEWQRNPYNKKNGGPCATPADFFSNPVAKQAYKNYLRYFVARWGYSSTIAAWEFWNEIDITVRKEHVPDQDLITWHKEMSDYLNTIDPYGHIITTSLSHGDNPDLWQLKNIDLTHVHRYMPSEHFVEQTVEFVNKYHKPHVIGEYAIGWKGPGNDFSDERYEDEFHDGLWRGFMSPAAILPMSWWWDYIYDKHQYFHFKALGTVLAEMVKQPDTFAPVKISPESGFQIYGLSSGKWTLVWLKKMADATTLSMEVPVATNGNYRIRQMNTRTNEFIRDIQIPSSKGKIMLNKLDLGDMKDMAIIITAI